VGLGRAAENPLFEIASCRFGYDDAPHGHAEVDFSGVTVPASNILLGEGRGFEIAQGRLGPGRLHHCMRVVGMAERAMELMRSRLHARSAFGGPLSQQGALQHKLAECRISLEQARLMVLHAAYQLDTHGNKVRHSPVDRRRENPKNQLLEAGERWWCGTTVTEQQGVVARHQVPALIAASRLRAHKSESGRREPQQPARVRRDRRASQAYLRDSPACRGLSLGPLHQLGRVGHLGEQPLQRSQRHALAAGDVCRVGWSVDIAHLLGAG
jgi:hypothetical protein